MKVPKTIATLATVFLLARWLGAQGLLSGPAVTASESEIMAAAKMPTGAPHFNGAKLIGIHPGTPLVFSLPVSGQSPITFSALHLPDGLQLDPATGIITGVLTKPGEYRVTVTAENAFGKAKIKFKIVAGSQLALTPPLGWNSYDAYGDSVTEDETFANAAWMKQYLQPFGWDTIVVKPCLPI